MSVLITGMEMPKDCDSCPCAYFTEGVHHDFCQAVGYDSEIKRDSGWKLDNCPLVPAADVVPVVRCKECKYRHDDDFCGGRGWPAQLVQDDGYCDRSTGKDGAE